MEILGFGWMAGVGFGAETRVYGVDLAGKLRKFARKRMGWFEEWEKMFRRVEASES